LPENGNSINPSFSGELPLDQLAKAGVAIHVHDGGVVKFNDRSISVTGNVNGSAINAGDHVSQTVNWGTQETQAYEKLQNEIKELSGLNADEAQDAAEILDDLKKKNEEGTLRPSLFKRMWNQLPKAVTLLRSAAEVYNNFNLSE